MPPVFRHGRKTSITLQDSGGVARDFGTVSDTSGLQRQIEAAEVTTYGKDNKVYIAGLIDGTFSLGGPWDATFDGYISGIIQYDGSRNIVFGPEGNTTGRVRYTIPVIVTSYNISPPVGDKVSWTADFQFADQITRDVY